MFRHGVLTVQIVVDRDKCERKFLSKLFAAGDDHEEDCSKRRSRGNSGRMLPSLRQAAKAKEGDAPLSASLGDMAAVQSRPLRLLGGAEDSACARPALARVG